MQSNLDWIFISSNVEANILGANLKPKSNIKKSGILYRLVDNDLQITIIGFIRKVNFSINDISFISWKFYAHGKLTIVGKSFSTVYISNANPNSLITFIKKVSKVSQECLTPPLKMEMATQIYSNTVSTRTILNNGQLDTPKFKKRKFSNTKIANTPVNQLNSLSLGRYNTSNKNNNLSILPEEILYNIFSMLTKPICNLGNSKNTIFFRDELFESTNIPLTCRRFFNLYQYNMWEIKIIPEVAIKFQINGNYKNLKSLVFNRDFTNEIELKKLATSRNLSTNIRKFSINQQKKLTDKILKLFFLRLKNLESLEILDCKKINGKTSFSTLKNIKSLKYLKIGSTDKPNYFFEDDSLLELSGLTGQNEVKTKNENPNSLELLQIELLNCYNITKLSFLQFCGNNIEYLNLKGCKGILEEEFVHISKHLQNLKVLILANCTVDDQNLEFIFMNCKKIEFLDISNCVNITEKSISKIHTELIKIKGIKLSYCLNFELSSLINILSECRELEWLDLSGCCQIGSEIFYRRVQREIPPSFKCVSIYRLSIEKRLFKRWLLENSGSYSTPEIEVLESREILYSEFLSKYEANKKNFLERDRPIWEN
ncbi:F-box domain [Cryptosporidium bovis]|uniref:F-box domain n=1 Tax=Cryptosporidium bovis TaxID=310047 RepID=UPI00351A8A3E|nr:F-box domain [Cryptosporidium bovis]